MATTMIKITCSTCKTEFEKIAYEVKRQLKKNPNADFYCCKKCASIGAHAKQKKPIIKKVCPVCGNEFETSSGKKGATFCSRSCASKGSVNDARRNAGKKAAAMNFTPDTHDIHNIQLLLKQRESWKYEEIKKFLDFIKEPYEFEYMLDNKYIYDLALFNKHIVIEFDGPEHEYANETDKEQTAKNFGFNLVRIKITPNTVIKASEIYHLF